MLAKVSALNSRYFLHCYGYTLCLRWETTRFMAIVTELMTGDLSTALKAYRQNMSSKIDIMSQIAHGVEILHQHHIIHRDLKSNNILVNVNTTTHRINDVKIGDFGGAIQLDSDATIYFADNTWGTTKRWTAPEGFRCEYSKAYDIYSLGILFWEIITDCQRPPFANIANDYEVGRRNYQNDRWNPLPLSTPTAIAKLITRCNHFFPEQRPNATQVVEEIDQLIVADVVAAMVTEIVEEKNDNKAKLSTR
jgi:serine/threonine protein kinase